MANAVVLLFLLDSLPDFNNVINSTLHKLTPGMIGVTCDSELKQPVLEVIAKKLNLTADSLENLQNIELTNSHNKYKFQELSPESLSNIVDYNFHESYEFSAEKSGSNFIGHNYVGNESNNDLNVNATGNGSFPESASFLAAIFESVGNVTAQTCGGVVLSKYWVLTAASCLNVLGPIYSNLSNETLENYYSIVVGAKNPLKDGSVHQVSKIYLHPTPSNGTNHSKTVQHQDLMKNWFNSLVGPEPNVSAPSLALFRIHPGVEEGILPMMDSAWSGDARLYGWALEKHDSSYVTAATALPAKLLSPGACKKSHGISGNGTMLCLSVNETSSNSTKINSGCPLVVVQDGRPTLFAVAVTDGTRPLLATPLSAHRDWLQRLTVFEKYQ